MFPYVSALGARARRRGHQRTLSNTGIGGGRRTDVYSDMDFEIIDITDECSNA